MSVFFTAEDVLQRAASLYGVSNGQRMRTMIDAVRDAMPDLNNYEVWDEALDALTQATKSGLSYYEWETSVGRTTEECRTVIKRAIPIAKRNAQDKRERQYLQSCGYCSK